MPDRDADEDLAGLVAELVTALEELEDELETPRERGFRPPTPRELRRFSAEVAIPAAVLVLETNIRALRLVQRALRLSGDVDRAREDAATVGEHARAVSETTLDQLDDTLANLETALRGRPGNDEAARLVEDARQLRAEVRSRLAEAAGEGETVDGGESADPDPQVDVDAELESIKAELDDSGKETNSHSGGETDGKQQGETSGDRDSEESERPEDGNADDSGGPTE